LKKNIEEMPNDKLLNELNYYKQKYEELKIIMEATFDQITVTDGKGVFLQVNNSSEEIFGMTESEMIGKSVYDYEKLGVFKPSITVEVLKYKKRVTIIQETSFGKRLLATGIPMFNEKGKIIRVINVSKDITESERLKNQLEDTERTLEWFRTEMNKNQTKDENIVVGNSNLMKKIIELIEHISNMDTTVILLGETGVGKSLIAKTIHQMSKRRNNPFIHINCGAMPENLIESELFGYEEGAFTGAVKTGKIGLLEAAGEGTIFLDEIGELSMPLQVKLLHVLQEKQAFRIGSVKSFEIKARIISATNKDLKKLIKEGKFREDLYYRLNVVPISIPSLRERSEDIHIFINYFLEKFNQRYNLSKQVSLQAYKLLSTYYWPGNIRELENTIERLVITCDKDVIEENHIFDISTVSPGYVYEINGPVSLKKAIEEFEKKILLNAVEKYKTTRRVAEALEIDQSTVVKKLKKIREGNLSDYKNHMF